jgi:chorismate mutase/prephenate dehydratase
MSGDEISRLRGRIDRIDDTLLRALNRRAALARRIGALKDTAGPAYRPEREAEVLRRLVAANRGPLAAEAVRAVFGEVISACRALERRPRIAFLGPPGTFSELAVHRHFGSAVDARACASIDEVFHSAETGAADFALVPVENSTEGAVGRSLDLLLATPLRICAEVGLRVRHDLMRRVPGLDGVRRVYSHAQSLAQCQKWLAQHLPRAARVPVASNGEAAQRAARERAACAIGPGIAARRYGLQVLVADIQDEPNNRTRFLVLGTLDPARTGRDATSLVMSAPNRPGALHALLAPMARHGVSLSRLESRPTRLGQWEYYFYADLVGHRADPPVAAALDELAQLAPFLKILGSYPVAE